MGPKGQHFIPRMHLEYFAGSEPVGQVWTYDAATGKSWSCVPKETAVQSHFYSVPTDDGSMDTRIEQALSQFEGRAAPVYGDLVAFKIPQGQARAHFAEFLALMFARTPAMRRMQAEVIGQGLQIQQYAYATHAGRFAKLMERYEADSGKALTPEEKENARQAMLDPSGYRLEIPQTMTLHSLGIADKLAPIFFEMHWALIEPEHGFFVTSDNPVVRLVDPSTRHPMYGDHGFLNKTSEVTFPLTPKLMLLMSWSEAPVRRAMVPKRYVRGMNEARAAHSERYLYAHLHHRDLERLAAKFKSRKPKMVTSGFGPRNFMEVTVGRVGPSRLK